jgi:O-glycosyl hydrolase
MIKKILFFWSVSILSLASQNQLPVANGFLEDIENNEFQYWSHQANEGGDATYSIETDNLVQGSTKALKCEVHSLGANGWHVSSKSEYPFQVNAGQKYTVTFYAKVEGADSRQMKLVFQSEVSGSYQGQNIWITNEWKRYSHTFTVEHSSDNNRVRFWYMQSDVTYFLDEVSISPGDRITFAPEEKNQTVDGFGAGIKRRTEHLYVLNDSFRQQIEEYCFEDLEVNMIRFFLYHDLEPENDNNDPYTLDESQLDWTRYDSDPNNWRTRYVGEALQNAFNLSINGFDHVIGNSNSAPGWLKTNGQHNGGGTLISGGESEFSEFLVAFINGMESRYGIGVTAISPTNEPDYEVSYESMNTTPSELSSILINLNSRLANSGLDNIKIVSPECFRVESQNAGTSATNYINAMFQNSSVEEAVDIVGTHTYADPNHNANWNALKVAANGKPVWVTESANLGSTDQSMTDAANYIKWIIRGFNEGGVTAYMLHLFYEEADSNGYSSLVAWTPTGEIILPKRYHSFKHFTNLVKMGYSLISSNSTDENGVYVGGFISEDESKIILQVFNEGEEKDFSMDIPIGAISVERILTTNNASEEFTSLGTQEINYYDRYFTTTLPELSLTSFVFNIDESLSNSSNYLANNNLLEVRLYPNPSEDKINILFTDYSTYSLNIFDLKGQKIMQKTIFDNEASIDISEFQKGTYLLKISSMSDEKTITKKIIKQ